MDVNLAEWPEDSVVVNKLPNGGAVAFLYMTPIETPMEDGTFSVSGTMVEVSFPQFYEGLKADIVNNFNYYWSVGLDNEIRPIKKKLLAKIKTLLANTDYKQSKWTDGALTDAEYEPTKLKRVSWRAAYNAVENATTIAEINMITILAE